MPHLLCCVPNFSEGRDAQVLAALLAAAAGGGHVLDSSADQDHNRVVITLAGEQVEQGAFRVVAAAVEQLDLSRHAGVHPRRGVADVVPFVPLGGTPLEAAVSCAHALGDRVWSELRVPVYFYGAAGKHRLARVRSSSPPPPDLGDQPHPTAGVVCVGARQPLVAYNALLPGLDIAAGRRLARSLRESSGGIAGIQALAFAVRAGTQLSMNLTRPTECPPIRALTALRGLAGAEHVGQDEVVGLCPALPARGCHAADGKLLEARLARAAAHGAARECGRRTGSEEMVLLGARLAAEGEALGRLGWEAALEGAERSAALLRVLTAGQIRSAELRALLTAAAEGFRAAVGPESLTRFPERVTALDRWLANPGEA